MWFQELFFPHPVQSSHCVRKLQNVHLFRLAPQQRISTSSLRAFHIFSFKSGCFNGGRNEIYCCDHVPVLNGNRGLEGSLEHKEAKKPQKALPLPQKLQHLCVPMLFFSFWVLCISNWFLLCPFLLLIWILMVFLIKITPRFHGQVSLQYLIGPQKTRKGFSFKDTEEKEKTTVRNDSQIEFFTHTMGIEYSWIRALAQKSHSLNILTELPQKAKF